MSVKCFARNSGAGSGCANFMGAWKHCVLSAGKPIKFLVLRGVFGVLWRGGSADFIFMGTGIFLNNWRVHRKDLMKAPE